jgi:hypothetical protein
MKKPPQSRQFLVRPETLIPQSQRLLPESLKLGMVFPHADEQS